MFLIFQEISIYFVENFVQKLLSTKISSITRVCNTPYTHTHTTVSTVTPTTLFQSTTTTITATSTDTQTA